MAYRCATCKQSFTRSENLARHQRARHDTHRQRPFSCELCNTSFARRDVCKRHMDRCARGLNTRKRRTQEPSVETSEVENDAATVQLQDDTSGPVLEQPVTFQPSKPVLEVEPPLMPPPTDQTEMLPTLASYDTYNVPSSGGGKPDTLSSLTDFEMSDFSSTTLQAWLPDIYQLSHRGSALYVTAYFSHFHQFLPILHRPSFSLLTSPKPLLSIVVAIGSLYRTQSLSADEIKITRAKSKEQWAKGMKEMKERIHHDSSVFREPWVLQAWILHIVYGCFYGDEKCFSTSKSMLQTLVDNVRSLGLFNQDLTFSPTSIWTADLENLASWDEALLSEVWAKFASQEAIRMCVYALIFCDIHISSPCNARALISTTESNWSLLPSTETWEAVSAEDWFEHVQDEMERGILTSSISVSSNRAQAAERLTLLHASQSLMTGKPTPRLLKRLSRSPFATLCVVANIEVLIRDFTRCYYQMPPGLPDPSAFHVLSQDQNKCMNAAISSILKLASEGCYSNETMTNTIQLHCWAARLSLCEPDDLLVSGIADNTITAGIATSAHLILGSHVASRRATASVPRKFVEGSSMTIWDDLLKCLASAFELSHDKSTQEPPWVTILNYRTLLILWRTLRRAITELGADTESQMQNSSFFNPAKMIVSIVSERAKRYLGAEDIEYGCTWDDLPGIEIDFLCLVRKLFAKRTASPIARAAEDIMQEIVTLMSEA